MSRLLQLVSSRGAVRTISRTLSPKCRSVSTAHQVPVASRGEIDAPPLHTAPDNSVIRPVLDNVRALMQNGIGGSDTWLKRLDNIRSDLESRRKPRIASERFFVDTHILMASPRR
jgi:hypothetical protein